MIVLSRAKVVLEIDFRMFSEIEEGLERNTVAEGFALMFKRKPVGESSMRRAYLVPKLLFLAPSQPLTQDFNQVIAFSEYIGIA